MPWQKYMPWFNNNNIIIILIFKTKYFEDIHYTIIHVSYTIFIHDVYIVYTSMDIHIMYINVHIHEGLNPKFHGSVLRSSPSNHFKSFDKIKRKLNFIIFNMKLLKKFELKHTFSFSKFIQMLQMKTRSLNLFNNLFMKIIIIYDYVIRRVKKKLKITCYEYKK
jgi:hypothetical protein